MKQKNSWADLLDEEECLGCRIIYSIFSNFPPMPSARAYNVETGEFFPFDRMRSLPNGYEMAKALGIAWTCNCRGRRRAQLPAGADVLGSPYGNSPRKPQNLGDAQSFEYTSDVMSDDVWELAASDRGSMYACDIISAECRGSILREFPSQYLNSSLNDIQGDARVGVKAARKALKLLNDSRFKK
ncbi:hypothetical protein GXB81_24870 [Paraburkholderia sp. Ac-20336]|uniref:hypothetical protein n=1 Tax=unclassified Paraburkholderia TaxID=2615204 RepID=UPI00197ED23D|nr:hypothetical protein [Paraburkholderia sp. Ac-20336]MBN3850896.1 hypothetical protein [Paraburkholderia sp. Ac-20342]